MAILAALLACVPTVASAQDGPPQRPDTRQVMFVGKTWEGTADIVDASTFERLARINTIPDKEEPLISPDGESLLVSDSTALRGGRTR